ncbi:glucan biosynthesis protein [Desulfosarcina sp.]|uniref:glucan biosynthesis protein n=1 Tax=Desulfosarcina sp. TaxID=2027861 RepID=UPI0039706ADA
MTTITVKSVIALLLISLGSVHAQSTAAAAFGFENVEQTARELATRPFEAPENEVPDFLLDLSYDQWRDIRFRTEKSLWQDEKLPFEAQFFHPGCFYDRFVEINIVDGSGVHPYPYDPSLFDYGNNSFAAKIPEKFGFAGFRLHYPINRNDYRDEVVVFLGASYFRAIAKNQTYGLSARGVAVDTALDSGEEFPYFKKFWLVKPDPGANTMVIFALLDSASLTGAYKFIIEPGSSTQTEVTLTLFARKAIKKLGLAALTSMYFYGESDNCRPVDDFRPEIHDSDGLLMAYPSGEFVWRPLVNYKSLFTNAFVMPDLLGFGLIQRDQNFNHYQDLETHYEKRPSTWVTPVGDWGAGHVELIQIPTKSEKNDNIVAFWTPEQALTPDRPHRYRYGLSWFSADNAKQHALGYVAATRTAAVDKENQRKLIVDFTGGRLSNLPTVLPAEAPLEPVITVQGEGEVVESQLYHNESGNGWRLVFIVQRQARSTLEKVLPDNAQSAPIEIRAYIRQAGQVLTESWSYAIRF